MVPIKEIDMVSLSSTFNQDTENMSLFFFLASNYITRQILLKYQTKTEVFPPNTFSTDLSIFYLCVLFLPFAIVETSVFSQMGSK